MNSEELRPPPEIKLVGLRGGAFYKDEGWAITTHDPIFEISSDPGYVHGQGFIYNPVDPDEVGWDKLVTMGMVRSKNEELERDGGGRFSDFVDNFAGKNITIRPNQTLAFLGPEYREHLLELGIEPPSETFSTNDGFAVSVIEQSEYEAIVSRYHDQGIKVLEDEIGSTVLGESTSKMEVAEKVLNGAISDRYDERENWLAFAAYGIQTLDLGLALNSTIIYAINNKLSYVDFFSEAVGYFEQLKTNKPLTAEERKRLEAFIEEANREFQELNKDEANP